MGRPLCTYPFIATLAAGLTIASLPSPAAAQVIFQQFYYPIDKPPAEMTWWQQAAGELPALSRLGIGAIWHPVPVKGGSGSNSMGYDPYDLYDLGSKNQKGTVATRFGTRDQYLAYVATAHANGIRVYADVVLNHTGGADVAEENPIMARLNLDDIPDDSRVAERYRPPNYNTSMNLRSWTGFLPVGADGQPGTGRFPRSWKNFHPSEDEPDRNGPYHQKEFAQDYAFFADNNYAARGLTAWGNWFAAQSGVDGMRLDAVKLIDPPFLSQFAGAVQKNSALSGGPFFLVGEFWDTNQKLLSDFQTATGNRMSLFDFGLFYALRDMTEKPEQFDMRDLLRRRFADRERAVSFVSNHDVDRSQPIPRTKRALPYAITMVMAGRPSIFYLDYFRPEDPELPKVLESLVPVYNRFAKGKEIVRYADPDVLALEREGNLLAVFNDGGSGPKTITVPTGFGKKTALCIPSLPLQPVIMGPGGAASGVAPDQNNASPTSYQTDRSDQVTLTVPPSGYILLVRADATNRRYPDRFTSGPLPTTQTTEFAEDLDTGSLGTTPREVTVRAALGTRLEASGLCLPGEGSVTVEARDANGTVLASTTRLRGVITTVTIPRLVADGSYRLVITAPGSPIRGRLRITYTAPKSEGTLAELAESVRR